MSIQLPAHPRDNEPWPSSHPDDPDDLDKFVIARGLTVRDKRQATMCESCGHPSWDPDTGTDDTVERPCDHGCCVVFGCAECGHYNSGMGVAGCPCDDGI